MFFNRYLNTMYQNLCILMFLPLLFLKRTFKRGRVIGVEQSLFIFTSKIVGFRK